ncbi:ABC transporter ATP-binding protein [Rathayibacter soli]|uniref:ABC transporter ATP-binding protein n=1 Tax=Rathayibacter soli TaxID=3144168 RepID=UPI0027E3B997|nr:ABC transporter ATP-binding protein [Glaciibacter superstes]
MSSVASVTAPRTRGEQPAATPVLELRDLNVWFDTDTGNRRQGSTHTVKGINLSVGSGERVGLVGESGCGKTTTILAALGLLPASASVGGEVLLNGENIIATGEASIRSHRWNDIAMVFQGAMSAFNPVKTIGWQITEALQKHHYAKGREAATRVSELLELVGLPAETAGRYPHQLSGGMKQRAIIAMALSCDPKVLLADEPTTALDVVVQDQILRLLVRLSEELNLALILVTHDLGVVAQSCTRAAVMRDGVIVEQGTVDDLYRRPKHPYTRSLFESTPSLDGAREDADQDDSQASPPASPAAPLLAVRGLKVIYPNRGSQRDRAGAQHPAVDGVSFTVQEGDLVSLVGQSGCGKTTTLHSIMGLIAPSAGSIAISGAEVVGLNRKRWQDLRRQVQMIYQDPYEALDVRFRVEQTVEEPLLIHRIGGGRKERAALIAQALTDVGLAPEQFAQRYPHELSGGQRQRVAIAASLVLRPALLLADEPVSMLDVSVRTGILELLDRLRHEHRMGILMITHDLSTAATYSDRIVVMKDGQVVEDGTPWRVIHEPESAYTRQLLASVPNPDPLAPRQA